MADLAILNFEHTVWPCIFLRRGTGVEVITTKTRRRERRKNRGGKGLNWKETARNNLMYVITQKGT